MAILLMVGMITRLPRGGGGCFLGGDSGRTNYPFAQHPVEESKMEIISSIHYDVYIMMTRTQVSFERPMLRRARDRAGKLGISLAEYIRRLVAQDLEQEPAPSDPSAVFDLGSSGGSDIAADKDAMVGRAFGKGAS
jgi:hypothetical protein